MAPPLVSSVLRSQPTYFGFLGEPRIAQKTENCKNFANCKNCRTALLNWAKKGWIERKAWLVLSLKEANINDKSVICYMFTWVWWIYSLPWLIWAASRLLHFSWSTFFTCLSLAGHQGTNWCSAEEETNVVFYQSSPRRTSSLLGVIVSSTRSSQYIKLWATAGPYWQNFFLQFFSPTKITKSEFWAALLNIFKIMIAIILLILLMIMRMGGGVVSKFNYSQAEQLPPRIHLIIIIIVSLSLSNFRVFIIIFRCDSIS